MVHYIEDEKDISQLKLHLGDRVVCNDSSNERIKTKVVQSILEGQILILQGFNLDVNFDYRNNHAYLDNSKSYITIYLRINDQWQEVSTELVTYHYDHFISQSDVSDISRNIYDFLFQSDTDMNQSLVAQLPSDTNPIHLYAYKINDTGYIVHSSTYSICLDTIQLKNVEQSYIVTKSGSFFAFERENVLINILRTMGLDTSFEYEKYIQYINLARTPVESLLDQKEAYMQLKCLFGENSITLDRVLRPIYMNESNHYVAYVDIHRRDPALIIYQDGVCVSDTLSLDYRKASSILVFLRSRRKGINPLNGSLYDKHGEREDFPKSVKCTYRGIYHMRQSPSNRLNIDGYYIPVNYKDPIETEHIEMIPKEYELMVLLAV